MQDQHYAYQYHEDPTTTINRALRHATGYTQRQWDQNIMPASNPRSIGDIMIYNFVPPRERNMRDNEITRFRNLSGLDIHDIIPFSTKPSDFPPNPQNLSSSWLENCRKLVEKTGNDDQKARRLVRQAVYERTGVAGDVMVRKDLLAARDLAIKEEGFQLGHAQGYTNGHADGHAAGLTDQGYAVGFKDGRRQAWAEREKIAANPDDLMDLTQED
ncbi:uncharacterized protein MYCFIDRAFT_79215 [Pseudocercospora fijiensis CIRAD86]|uniref:Uncharacterized protein n=1 Tax=Pseudocercospora fijiensis (strain CIRAD86) TaxID=383855 RepID=M2YJP0_PSEFD|nr:uncharacterized protein MYCFIDRAFT_79215 [Pseudocercospora fijiensis CIRAD86]EME77970.1 hypothetical protein MYCFIDRAFT_79215 [Pseudocercospora fijiensis CIRAD86]